MDTYTSPDHDRAALVTIDVQRDTLDGQPFEIPGTSSAVPQIARAVEFFRARSQPIVHVVRLYKADGTNVDQCRRLLIERGGRLVIAGSAGSQIAPPLLPSPEVTLVVDLLLAGEMQTIGPVEWVMYKPRWGAFFGTDLEQHLRSLQVSTLVFAGCNFPNCPRASIYEASERDFRIVVLADALSGLYPVGRKELENIGACVLDTEAYLSAAGASGLAKAIAADRLRRPLIAEGVTQYSHPHRSPVGSLREAKSLRDSSGVGDRQCSNSTPSGSCS